MSHFVLNPKQQAWFDSVKNAEVEKIEQTKTYFHLIPITLLIIKDTA